MTSNEKAIAVLVAGALSCLSAVGGIGYRLGYWSGQSAEREEARRYVNQGMIETGFCRWFQQSRIAEDCAKSGQLPAREGDK